MSRFERILWRVAYFGFVLAIIAVLIARVPFGRATAIIAGAVVTLAVSGWRQFHRRIVRDLGWGLRTAVMRTRAAFNPAVLRFVTRNMVARRAHDLIVLDFDNDDAIRARRCERVSSAIDRIQHLCPSRYARLQRLRPRILVGDFAMAGGYMLGTNTIVMHPALIDQWQPESVACVLCHELLHFYIDRRGVPASPWTETRSELLADREMRLWARRVLAVAGISSQALAELKTLIDDNLYTRSWWRRDGSRVHGSEFRPGTA